MEPVITPIDNNLDNSTAQHVAEDPSDEIIQDFNEFRERISRTNLSADMKLEDLIDQYIESSGQGSNSAPDPLGDDFAALLEDSDMFESMLLSISDQVGSACTNGFNTDAEFQECDMMFKEMSENASQSDTLIGFPACSRTMSMNCHEELSSKRVTYIRHGEMNYGDGDVMASILGGVSGMGHGSAIRHFRSGMNFWQQVGVGDNANRSTTISREKVKRQYRKIKETEKRLLEEWRETAIENREAVAKTHTEKGNTCSGE